MQWMPFMNYWCLFQVGKCNVIHHVVLSLKVLINYAMKNHFWYIILFYVIEILHLLLPLYLTNLINYIVKKILRYAFCSHKYGIPENMGFLAFNCTICPSIIYHMRWEWDQTNFFGSFNGASKDIIISYYNLSITEITSEVLY